MKAQRISRRIRKQAWRSTAASPRALRLSLEQLARDMRWTWLSKKGAVEG